MRKSRNGVLLAYVADVALKHESDDCLIWPFGTDSRGYGQVRFKGRQDRSHRVVCWLFHGAPSGGKTDAAHSCGNRLCVNPRHLSWKTHRENEADKVAHGTIIRGEACNLTSLTESDVLEIRNLKGLKTQVEIAAQFGTTQQTVSKIQSRKRWAWLE
ncbi:HNH endonuclease [Achromobacter deleyi]|uniref:HNH endonuclease n=1 Tax=Achromobacter deleyi TaxID=1353891 RepID=UPI0034648DAA